MDAIDNDMYDEDELEDIFEDEMPRLRPGAIEEEDDSEPPIGETVEELPIEETEDPEQQLEQLAGTLTNLVEQEVEQEIEFLSPKKTRSSRHYTQTNRSYAQVVKGVNHSTRSAIARPEDRSFKQE